MSETFSPQHYVEDKQPDLPPPLEKKEEDEFSSLTIEYRTELKNIIEQFARNFIQSEKGEVLHFLSDPELVGLRDIVRYSSKKSELFISRELEKQGISWDVFVQRVESRAESIPAFNLQKMCVSLRDAQHHTPEKKSEVYTKCADELFAQPEAVLKRFEIGNAGWLDEILEKITEDSKDHKRVEQFIAELVKGIKERGGLEYFDQCRESLVKLKKLNVHKDDQEEASISKRMPTSDLIGVVKPMVHFGSFDDKVYIFDEADKLREGDVDSYFSDKMSDLAMAWEEGENFFQHFWKDCGQQDEKIGPSSGWLGRIADLFAEGNVSLSRFTERWRALVGHFNPESTVKYSKRCQEDYQDFSDELPVATVDTLRQIDFSLYQKAWEKSHYKLRGADRSRKFMADNIRSIIGLESVAAGSTKTLTNEFGIKDFARYSESILVHQYKERTSDKPYGVVMFPEEDYNGAFELAGEALPDFWKQLSKHDMALRIVEGESKIALGKQLIKLNRRYGEKNKVSFAVIGGHGNTESIRFGHEELIEREVQKDNWLQRLWQEFKDRSGPKSTRQIFRIEDLKGKGVRRIADFFVEDPAVILVSCSTGTKGGIGQKISKVFNAHVVAPDEPTNISKASIKLGDGNKLVLDADFYEGEAKVAYASGKMETKKKKQK